MGVNSKIVRYHESGENANVNNVAKFGEPSRSLFTSTKVFTLHHRMEITDGSDKVMYRAKSKVISLHDKTDIIDAAGKAVAHIEAKVISIHERHFITMSDGTKFELSSELLHIVKDILNVEGLGWQMRGNILQLNFELYDQDGSIIAVVGQKLISLHDKFCIDIYKPEDEQKVIALLITLQHIITEREEAAAAC